MTSGSATMDAPSPHRLVVERLVHRHDAVGGELLRLLDRGLRSWRDAASGSRSSSTARRPIASTEPTGSRMPLTPSSTTSGSPPARVATTGAPQAIASSAARPNDSVCDGQHEEIAALEQRRDRVEPAEEPDVLVHAELARLVLGVDPLGAVADHDERGRHGAADPGEDPDHVLHPLHLAEIRDVGDDLVALRRQRAGAPRLRRAGTPSGSRSWGSPGCRSSRSRRRGRSRPAGTTRRR